MFLEVGKMHKIMIEHRPTGKNGDREECWAAFVSGDPKQVGWGTNGDKAIEALSALLKIDKKGCQIELV
jgi:hypothetical protein